MNKLMRVVAALVIFLPILTQASPITFTHQGNGTGSIGNGQFSADFTIVATGDTSARQSFGSGYWIDHLSATIEIVDVGTFSFITPTRTFVNNGSAIVGFSRAGGGGADLFNGPIDALFNSWDMLSSIGPVAGYANLLQWDMSAVNTDGGVLSFVSARTAASFEAVTGYRVPAPASLLLLGCLIMWLGRLRR